ncbi:MAG: Smr/MutS family protein, partial [Ignavibacteriaceae bacterium]|nr:Smr/MutS family protein [Ignavibacteriaceae bacterium]
TGPNAGGKTVVLKTIGLLSLMIKCGYHVPVSADSNFRLFDKILLDIGDEQSIEDDLSTFSSHLSNIKNILSESDRESLVLLDEIGTGTDPAEGSALAAAVLLSLRNNGATVFATTHHGNLKLIANEETGFENAAMEFDHENLKPTYKFKQGIPGSSYAFEIAKRIGFEEDFLDLAKSHLETDKHELEKFLVEIEHKSKLAEDKFRKAEIENVRLAELTNLYKQKLEKLEIEKKEILRKTKHEAETYLQGVNRKVEQVIKVLKETNAQRDVIKNSHKIINTLKEDHKNLFNDGVDLNKEIPNFAAGDFVSIKDTNTTGEIEAIIEEKQKALLKVGSLRMTASLSVLVPAKRIKEKTDTSGGYQHLSSSNPQLRLDIRGERPDAAEFEVIRFLDESYSSGVERVEILHGKGTGALKRTVKDILKGHDKVKNFYFAPIELGGDGITIAELK